MDINKEDLFKDFLRSVKNKKMEERKEKLRLYNKQNSQKNKK